MFIDGRQDRSNPITTIVEVNLSGETLEGRLSNFSERSILTPIERVYRGCELCQ